MVSNTGTLSLTLMRSQMQAMPRRYAHKFPCLLAWQPPHVREKDTAYSWPGVMSDA